MAQDGRVLGFWLLLWGSGWARTSLLNPSSRLRGLLWRVCELEGVASWKKKEHGEETSPCDVSLLHSGVSLLLTV